MVHENKESLLKKGSSREFLDRILEESGKAPPSSRAASCFNSVFQLNNKELLLSIITRYNQLPNSNDIMATATLR